jgi:hypothetical protein
MGVGRHVLADVDWNAQAPEESGLVAGMANEEQLGLEAFPVELLNQVEQAEWCATKTSARMDVKDAGSQRR